MEITFDHFVDICKSATQPFQKPNWKQVTEAICEEMDIEDDDKLQTNLSRLKQRYTTFMSKRKGKSSGQRSSLTCSDVVLEREKLTPKQEVVPEKKRKIKPLADLGNKQLKNRTEIIWNSVEKFANENNETPLRILGLLLKKCKNKDAQQFGDELWQKPQDDVTEYPSKLVSKDAAIAIMVDCSLGRETYTKLRKILKQEGHKILPSWTQLRRTQDVISPKPSALKEPHNGVMMAYEQSMKVTAKRIMESMATTIIPNPAVMNIKFGFDGSGSHAIYRQLNNEETNNIIMTMFCPLTIEDSSGNKKWIQKTPNSALTHRPLALQLGKESNQSLQFLKVFEDTINKMTSDGCMVVVRGKEISLKVNIISHMMDMKAANLYLGLGGAYCDLCDISKADCHDVERVKQGFAITRSITSLHSLFDDISTEDGSVVKSHNDYETRKGLTTKPIPNHEVLSVQVLHALLRTLDHFMKIIVHLRAGVHDWSESKTSLVNQFLKKAKAEVQEKLKNDFGERWDYPDATGKGGTTTTGNTARRILHQANVREAVVQMVPERYQPAVRQIGQYLSVVLRVFCSSRTVDVKEYKKMCISLNLLYLQSFPSSKNNQATWIRISPSLHKLLAHSWELIEMNSECGLKNCDESGLEANNKVLRSIRLKLARKTSQAANLTDVISRMFLGSDPKINVVRMEAQPFCKHCDEYGHSSRYCKVKNPPIGPLTNDDSLFASLIIDENTQ